MLAQYPAPAQGPGVMPRPTSVSMAQSGRHSLSGRGRELISFVLQQYYSLNEDDLCSSSSSPPLLASPISLIPSSFSLRYQSANTQGKQANDLLAVPPSQVLDSHMTEQQLTNRALCWFSVEQHRLQLDHQVLQLYVSDFLCTGLVLSFGQILSNFWSFYIFFLKK